MDLLQEQVASLHTKVDALQQTVEAIKSQTAEVASQLKGAIDDRPIFSSGSHSGRYTFQSRSVDMEMEHKDVLSDFTYPELEPQSGERSLAPEIQIQRLTAQLTAAYNRIAALEEQLLAKRIH